MDLPATKSALIAALEAGRDEWDAALAQVGSAGLEQPGVEGTWSVKQIVAHVAGYEEWAAAFLADRLDPDSGAMAAFDTYWQQRLDAYRRDQTDFPARMSDTDDDQTNELVVAVYDELGAAAVLERERQAYEQLLAAIRRTPEAQLVEPGQVGSKSIAAILPNQSYQHYQTHLPAIRRWLEQRHA